jgi:hypothetical protein
MTEESGEELTGAHAARLPIVQERISELQRRKRQTVRWHMSRDTAERAIAAITEGSLRPTAGKGKSRRRKRHKRLL